MSTHDGPLAGRVALVTGAGQGVGQGIALALASEGVSVAVLGRTARKLEETCDLLRDRGVEAEAFECDVADTEAIPGLVGAVAERFGRIDVLVNNAYAAAKQALRSLTRTAAVEWAPDGIRVNSIAPHALSPGLRWWTENNPEEAAEFVAAIPMRRIGDCEEDIGRAVAALVGDDLRYLTGATLPLDGGQAYFG